LKFTKPLNQQDIFPFDLAQSTAGFLGIDLNKFSAFFVTHALAVSQTPNITLQQK